MVSVTYSTFHDLYGLTTNDVSAAITENMIDQAIDRLNLDGNLSIANMTGSAGSKTATLTSSERGAVMEVTWLIYYTRDPTTASAGGIVDDPPNLKIQLDSAVHRWARKLQTRSFLRT